MKELSRATTMEAASASRAVPSAEDSMATEPMAVSEESHSRVPMSMEAADRPEPPQRGPVEVGRCRTANNRQTIH
jgi:hypothetical protein